MAGRIVCGVDDSRGGREALVAAAALGERLELGVLAVHATSAGRVFPYGDPVEIELERRRSIQVATELLDRIEGSGGRVADGDHQVQLGDPAAGLAAVAADEGAEMIVVGSRGRNRLSSALLGSVSRDVVAQAPCPVLVVPPGATGAPPPSDNGARGPSVLCGIDETPDAHAVAGRAAALARRLGVRLVLAHTYRPRPYCPGAALPARRAARDHLEAVALGLPPGAAADLRLERGDAAGELRRVAREESAELIVVGSPVRGPIQALVAGSVAAALAASAPAPVLVVTDGGWHEITASVAEPVAQARS